MSKPALIGILITASVILVGLLAWQFMGAWEEPLPPPAQLVEQVNSAPTQDAKVKAARQLIRHGRGARQEVRTVLRNHDNYEPEVVAPIIQATGKNRDYRSGPVLLDLLNHPDPKVRGQSAAAIQKILGAEFGFQANAPLEERQAIIARMRVDYERAMPRMQEFYDDQSE